MPRLRELEAFFMKLNPDRKSSMQVGDIRGDADGVGFLCPKCLAANKGPEGAHHVFCWFVGVPADVSPGPGRWNPQGATIDDLTFVGPGSVSVLLLGGCNWHGFVRGGEATPE